ncbi:hypothetical protein CAOG_05450 [Capsaspora owczarzaki ATCC 30864]|uniref:Uncharacterized protein n=1 Tax=Capsaspora owczarzaki (strain ATCC 30864) TaxID=595528 RepID=A0A0D2UIB8_CAPO3|nr:hypothetical protein CAOG_05450 [Capsaspora owczarzaki ATCC 30864]KJE94891.1 hypothetical protein CAOG_005450 [Capsaspora owczarzaki ATCC 30864]|eukprot:XP_004346123.2 hypothetical protein CAOG_05450 [Capsaspora owczarzaki ATCC 30864]
MSGRQAPASSSAAAAAAIAARYSYTGGSSGSSSGASTTRTKPVDPGSARKPRLSREALAERLAASRAALLANRANAAPAPAPAPDDPPPSWIASSSSTNGTTLAASSALPPPSATKSKTQASSAPTTQLSAATVAALARARLSVQANESSSSRTLPTSSRAPRPTSPAASEASDVSNVSSMSFPSNSNAASSSATAQINQRGREIAAKYLARSAAGSGTSAPSASSANRPPAGAPPGSASRSRQLFMQPTQASQASQGPITSSSSGLKTPQSARKSLGAVNAGSVSLAVPSTPQSARKTSTVSSTPQSVSSRSSAAILGARAAPATGGKAVLPPLSVSRPAAVAKTPSSAAQPSLSRPRSSSISSQSYSLPTASSSLSHPAKTPTLASRSGLGSAATAKTPKTPNLDESSMANAPRSASRRPALPVNRALFAGSQTPTSNKAPGAGARATSSSAAAAGSARPSSAASRSSHASLPVAPMPTTTSSGKLLITLKNEIELLQCELYQWSYIASASQQAFAAREVQAEQQIYALWQRVEQLRHDVSLLRQQLWSIEHTQRAEELVMSEHDLLIQLEAELSDFVSAYTALANSISATTHTIPTRGIHLGNQDDIAIELRQSAALLSELTQISAVDQQPIHELAIQSAVLHDTITAEADSLRKCREVMAALEYLAAEEVSLRLSEVKFTAS